jgi:hypothetical protein
MKIAPTNLNDEKTGEKTHDFGDIHQFMDHEHFVVDLKIGDQFM